MSDDQNILVLLAKFARNVVLLTASAKFGWDLCETNVAGKEFGLHVADGVFKLMSVAKSLLMRGYGLSSIRKALALLGVLTLRRAWCLYWKHRVDPVGMPFVSMYVSALRDLVPQPKSLDSLRKSFKESPKAVGKLAKNMIGHTHAVSASIRNNASATMVLFARAAGLNPYMVQMSHTDDKHGLEGCRVQHWFRDINVPFKSWNVKPGDVAVIVDTDMYMDMPNVMAEYPMPYLLTTFQPSAVASNSNDFNFTFLEDDVVDYRVCGGAHYTHKVWNYAHDTLTVTRVGDPLGLGLWYVSVTYNVEKHQISAHHQIIFLVPASKIVSPLFDLSKYLGHNTLQRLRVVQGDYLRLNVLKETDNGSSYVSTGRKGQYVEITISSADDYCIAAHARTDGTGLQPYTVHKVFKDKPVSESGIMVLTEYHAAKNVQSADVIVPVKDSVNHYQYVTPDFDPNAKQSITPFMSPIVDGCYAPTRSLANDTAAIKGRIMDVRNSEMCIDTFMQKAMEEFARRVVPDSLVGTGVPYGVDKVWDKQSRPTQRRIIQDALKFAEITGGRPISSFQKAEPYGKVTAPRIISTLDPVTKLSYSQFMYAFADLLRHHKWYAFGKTPKEISERVAEICKEAMSIVNTDLSRFDGHVSNILRTLECMIMQRYFHEEYSSDLRECQTAQVDQRAYTAHGVKYNTFKSRNSGSPETADKNSEDNAFMAFIAKLRTKRDGVYLTFDEAWDELGLYGGDDGITADIEADVYVKACASVGQVLEVETIPRHQLGVTFLARYYSDEVWTGNPSSMCDIKRQMSKLHVTTTLPASVSPVTKLCEKLAGYILSDRNTPILGAICRTVEELKLSEWPLKCGQGLMRGISSYNAKYVSTEQYPNVFGHWMVEQTKKDLPLFDFVKFDDWLTRVATADVLDVRTVLLSPPLCVPRTPVVPGPHAVVINGTGHNLQNPIGPLTMTVPCRTGKCQATEDCHCNPLNVNYQPSAPVTVAKAAGPCRKFRDEGTCPYGVKCKFTHVPKAPCKQFTAGNCQRGAACRYAH
jgi:hypothetical protein